MELKPSMTEAPPPGTHGRSDSDTALVRHVFGCHTLPEGHYIRWDGLAKRWLAQESLPNIGPASQFAIASESQKGCRAGVRTTLVDA